MLSRENAVRLQFALNVEDSANAEVQAIKGIIRGQEQELANAEARHATALAELNAVLEDLSIRDAPPAEPAPSPEPAQLPLGPGKPK